MSKNKTIGVIILFLIFSPTYVFAWGPGVHLSLGLSILDNLKLIIPNISEIISSYRWHFLYGCLSPDVLIGKGKKISRTHSHNWETGFKILTTKDLELKAYGIGYITHLAADVVAHNYFIPNMLQLFKLNRGKLFHILIEGCIDKKICSEQKILKELMRSNFKEADQLLIEILKKKKTIFKIKKELFKKGISLNFFKKEDSFNIKKYTIIQNKVLASWDYVEEMLDMSQKAIINSLNQGTSSELTRYDPMGFKHLKIAKTSNKLIFKKRYKGVVPFFVPSINFLNL